MSLQTTSQLWWAFSLRGIFAILFGLATILLPGATLQVTTVLLGALLLADGMTNGLTILEYPGKSPRWWNSVTQSILSILIGLVVILLPVLAVSILVTLLGIWLIGFGVFELLTVLPLWRSLPGSWMLLVTSGLSILLGFVVFSQPESTAIALITLLGAWLLLAGIILLTFGMRLRDSALQDIDSSQT